ncbi:MAG: ABC transporter ATP-binding protein/permease [Clostridia bacterium]|nr:ABC transporter ATP-binding protein/permease [Clostridia bacterium]
MLKLTGITKNYLSGEAEVRALKGIDIEFRKSEFVSILGHSGCGKTTLLNIIGGLDRYTSGDLIIKGKSTKDFKDKDWDSYRNYSVGFVFQNYNLIGHQTVLSNVELALTLDGVSKKERRKRAVEVLEKVGLKDQINKKPNQLSGGQMQRVAIARALVNDPEIVLADEPTGALDTDTSVQIMEILKEISKDRLIIMVTHNPDLAEKYSSRIVKILDGNITDDSNPFTEEDRKAEKEDEVKTGKTAMSFFTALNLSLNNLMTKKGRTLLTAFAGSIGIIGIALILSLSNGVQEYIDKVEEDTLSSYPIAIQEESVDMSTMMETLMNEEDDGIKHEDGKIYTTNIMTDIISSLSQEVKENNLTEFKNYLDNEDTIIKENSNAVQYGYGLTLNLYKEDEEGNIQRINPSAVMDSFGEMGDALLSQNVFMQTSMTAATDVWVELLDNPKLIESQYDVLAGKFPENYNEVVLIVDDENRISDYTLYTLGLKDTDEVTQMFKDLMSGKEVSKGEVEEYEYDDFMNLKYRLLLNTDYYAKENGIWVDKSNNQEYMKNKVEEAEEITVVGIIKPKPESNITGSVYGEICYLHSLSEHVINQINESEIVKEQTANPEINVFTGMEFIELAKTATGASGFDINSLTDEQKMQLASMSEEERLAYVSSLSGNANATYEGNLQTLSVIDLEKPKMIYIYPKSFEAKDNIKQAIEDYNKKQEKDGHEENVIEYTDVVGILMNSVTRIVNIISYVLIAFVAISLVVSSIMIGIITYISVLERTKEIGILRAIGASKKDIRRVFNAETFIIGSGSGILGILITLLLNIPINIIIKNITDVPNLTHLPWIGGIALILISMVLTIFAGLLPASFAAKKDPVEALRTE